MPSIKIPAQVKNWKIGYQSDYLNDIIESENIQYDVPFNTPMLPARSLVNHTVTKDDANITTPTDFIHSNFDGTLKYWAACQKLYWAKDPEAGGIDNTNFVLDTLTNTPATMVDAEMVVFGKCLPGGTYPTRDVVVVNKGDGELFYFNSDVSTTTWNKNWWTSTLGQSAMTTSIAHPMISFGNAPLLFVLDKNKLHSISTNIATSTEVQNGRLVFNPSYTGTWMVATPYKIYIGLTNDFNTSSTSEIFPGIVIEYDPFTEAVREFIIDEGPTVGFIKNNNINIVDFKGQVREFNGNDFAPYTNFPSVYTANSLKIHRNGILVQNRQVLFLVQTLGYGNVNAGHFLGGLWNYSPDSKNLYLRNSSTYYSGANTQLSYSNKQVTGVGALISHYNDALIAGLSVYIDGSTTESKGIWVDDWNLNSTNPIIFKRGSFITAKIPAPDINAVWRDLLVKYNPNDIANGTSTIGITIKYKIQNASYPNVTNTYSGTWVTGGVSFTTSTNLTSLGLVSGDEIMILSGKRAGANVSFSSQSGTGTYTISIAQPPTDIGVTAGQTFNFSVDNWQLVRSNELAGTITDATKQSALLDIPTNSSEWIQFKIELSGGEAIEELQVGLQQNLVVEKP